MISELNAPLPSFQPRTFSDLICSKLSVNQTNTIPNMFDAVENSTPTDILNMFMQIGNYLTLLTHPVVNQRNNPYRRNECFGLYSIPAKKRFVRPSDAHPEFLGYLIDEIFLSANIKWLRNPFFDKQLNLMVKLFWPIHSHHPRKFNFTWSNFNMTQLRQSIETELVECGKTVFIARSEDLQTEYNFLSSKYPWHKFYRGKEVLHETLTGVVFRFTRNSKLSFYYKSLVETGIQGRVEQEIASRANLHRDPVASESMKNFKEIKSGDSIQLNGAFSTFLIVWSAAVAISLPAFVFEVRNSIYVGIKFAVCIACFKFIKGCNRFRTKCVQSKQKRRYY